MEVALTLISLGILAAAVWVAVISIRFLRSGRKAFDRYLALTAEESGRLRHAGSRRDEPTQPPAGQSGIAPPARTQW